MFRAEDIIYEDNHILIVNKRCGDLVQPDPNGSSALEIEIKEFIKQRDSKPGDVFLGVVHRLDRPVSGAVMFAKTTKALVRLNEMIKNRVIEKRYWAIVCDHPKQEEAELVHHIVRDGKTNFSRSYSSPKANSKEARLRYKFISGSTNYFLLEIELMTGRHHQIRSQLSTIGMPIRGDLKYGASRSNKGGGISLHSRSLKFIHPVSKESIHIFATPPADDNLWQYFTETVRN